MAVRDLTVNIDFNMITRTHQTLSRLITHPPEVSLIPEGLGSGGTRTAEQKTIAGAHADNLLRAIPDRIPIVFTERSTLGNPGACGAAAVCYPTGLSEQPLILNKPLSSRSTSYHGEFFALKLAVEFCIDWRKTHNSREVHILSDCQSAISSVTSSNLHRSHQDVIDDIRRGVQNLESQSTTVKLHWIAGHVDSNGNELADKAAKEAAIEAYTLPKCLTVIHCCWWVHKGSHTPQEAASMQQIKLWSFPFSTYPNSA